MKKLFLAVAMLFTFSTPSDAALTTVTWCFGGAGNAANETGGVFQSELLTVGGVSFTLGLTMNSGNAVSDANGLGSDLGMTGTDFIFDGGDSVSASLNTASLTANVVGSGTVVLGSIASNDWLTAEVINYVNSGAGGTIDGNAFTANGIYNAPGTGATQVIDIGNMGSEFQISKMIGLVELTTTGGAAAVPEPSSLAFLSIVGLGLVVRRRR